MPAAGRIWRPIALCTAATALGSCLIDWDGYSFGLEFSVTVSSSASSTSGTGGEGGCIFCPDAGGSSPEGSGGEGGATDGAGGSGG